MSNLLQIGVVGAGVFGGYHANKCAAHERMKFHGIFDPDFDRAKGRAETHGVTAFRDYSDLLAAVDAVIIACPARFHGEMAIAALNAGKHCLIEKPIAANVTEAQTIVDLANDKGLIVQIGHQERFVAKAIGLDVAPTPLKISAIRHSPPSPRNMDVSVTLDLMIHDIDLCLMMLGGLPDRVQTDTISGQGGSIDDVKATLTHANFSATLSASRSATASQRVMELTYPSGQVIIDFNAKTLTNHSQEAFNADFGHVPDAMDSLGAATNAFVEAVLDNTPTPVTAQDGLNALRVALEIDTSK